MKSFKEFIGHINESNFEQGETVKVTKNISDVQFYDDEDLDKKIYVRDLVKGMELEVVSTTNREVVFMVIDMDNKFIVLSTHELSGLKLV